MQQLQGFLSWRTGVGHFCEDTESTEPIVCARDTRPILSKKNITANASASDRNRKWKPVKEEGWMLAWWPILAMNSRKPAVHSG